MRTLAALVVFVQILFLLLIPTPGRSAQKAYRILILHSYSMDYQWTKGVHQGIEETLRRNMSTSGFRVEFMDTKNYFDASHLNRLVETYRSKYGGLRVDGIVATDNNALDFITTYGAELFPDVPVVACGINDAVPPQAGSAVKSILAEESDHLGTVRQALRYWPEAKTLYVLYDETPTGYRIAHEVEQALEALDSPLNVELITGMTLAELKRFVATRRAEDLAYLVPFFRDAAGEVFAQGVAARELAEVSTVPMLASWAFQVGTGVIGGRVISSYNLGELAALTLVKVLTGDPVASFQTRLSVFENLYDYEVVEQFGIGIDLLPPDSRFINKPLSFYEKHRDALLPAAVVIAVLALIAALLTMNLRKQRIINAANRNLMALDAEVIDTQRELVSTLGEVIEARSSETGNHVKRVAKMSRLLGEKIGLSLHELDLLEAASPMHDVGKIGIPDSVLNKLGRLTDKEFELIKTHTSIGKELLGASDRELLRVAGTIAYQHHERWDGSGYPNGLKGEEISVFARITMLADVFDALLSKRAYKKAWPEGRVLKYIETERGKHFDPYLVDIFLSHLDEARAIRKHYS